MKKSDILRIVGVVDVQCLAESCKSPVVCNSGAGSIPFD